MAATKDHEFCFGCIEKEAIVRTLVTNPVQVIVHLGYCGFTLLDRKSK